MQNTWSMASFLDPVKFENLATPIKRCELIAWGTTVADTYPPNALDSESTSRVSCLWMISRGSPGIVLEQHIPQLLRSRSAQRREIRVNLVAFLPKQRIIAGWRLRLIFESRKKDERAIERDVILGVGFHCGQWWIGVVTSWYVGSSEEGEPGDQGRLVVMGVSAVVWSCM